MFRGDMAYLIKSNKKGLFGCICVEDFFKKNNIPYIVKYIDNFTMDEISEIIDILKLSLYELKECYMFDILEMLFTASFLSSKQIDYNNCRILDNDIVSFVYQNRKNIIVPIVFKDGISIIGYYGHTDMYQQYLQGQERENPKWLGAKECSDEEKVRTIMKNFTLPKKIKGIKKYNNDIYEKDEQRLYMPKTSLLYGGNIKWIFPRDIIDDDGYVIINREKIDKIDIKMIVELGNICQERSFIVKVV